MGVERDRKKGKGGEGGKVQISYPRTGYISAWSTEGEEAGP